MEAQRQAETTARLALLIDLLLEEAGESAVAPPPEAASSWSEAAIRSFFAGEGAPAESVVQPGQPGGGRVQPPPSAAGGVSLAALEAAQARLTGAEYRRVATARGIPPRQHGLFPPGDAVLAGVAANLAHQPFQKHLVSASGELELSAVSWPVGDDAASRGIDLRYFIDASSGFN